jgi:Uma2 family endonuclease
MKSLFAAQTEKKGVEAMLNLRDEAAYDSDELSDEDEFPHGWRRITEILSDGTVRYHDIPLSPEDFLNPEEGDQMPQGPEHAKEAVDIYNKLRKHYHNSPHTAVLFDTKMRWGIPDLKEPFPDITVIHDVRDKENITGSFDVIKEGTRPALIVEIMSPGYPGDDTAKVDIYEQAGVQEYIILNPQAKKKHLPFELTGYRLIGGKYRDMPRDLEGRLVSRTTGIRFGLGESGRELILTDALTGKELLSDEEEYLSRLDAEARAETAEARAETAEARAEQEARARENAEAELKRLKAELESLRKK